MPFRRDIQGLRAAAVLLVVCFHAGWGFDAGFIGVDIFMVISGFVIGGVLWTELAESGTVQLLPFLARRVRRILPALLALIAAVTLVDLVAFNPFLTQQTAIRTATSALPFVSNIYLYRHVGYFDDSADTNPFLHLWSLSVEEQFYVALPVAIICVAWLATRGGKDLPKANPRVLKLAATTVGVVSAISLALALGLTTGLFDLGVEAPGRLAFYSMPTRFWEFGAGIGVMLLRRRWAPPTNKYWAIANSMVVLCGLGSVVLVAIAVDPGSPHPGTGALIVVGATAAVLAVGDRSGLGRALLGNRTMVWLGDRSYAWYLWHWPALVITRVHFPANRLAPILAVAVSLAIASLSTVKLELPARAARLTPTTTMRRGIAASAATAVLLAITLTAAERGLGLDEPNGWYNTPKTSQHGCNHFNRDGRAVWPEEVCTTTVPDARGLVMVLGDQWGDSISTGAIDAATGSGFNTATWTRSGCPMVSAEPVHSPECAVFKSDVMAEVSRLRPTAVVIGNQSFSYVADPSAETALADPLGGHFLTSADAITAWQSGLTSLLDDFEERGIAVILVADGPDFGPTFSTARFSILNSDTSQRTVGVAEVRAARKDVFAAERLVVSRHSTARLVDPLPTICPHELCRPEVNGEWWFYDRTHLTVAGGDKLTQPITQALMELVG